MDQQCFLGCAAGIDEHESTWGHGAVSSEWNDLLMAKERLNNSRGWLTRFAEGVVQRGLGMEQLPRRTGMWRPSKGMHSPMAIAMP